MDDGRDLVFLKNSIKGDAIPQIDFIKRRPLPRDLRDTFQNGGLAVREVIYNNWVIARYNEGNNGMTSDIAGSTGDKNRRVRGLEDWRISNTHSCSFDRRFIING